MLAFVKLLYHVRKLHSLVLGHFVAGHRHLVTDYAAAGEVRPANVDDLGIAQDLFVDHVCLREGLCLLHDEVLAQCHCLGICVDSKH